MNHSPEHRDDAISWLVCFLVSVKQHLRNDKTFDCNEVAGFIDTQRSVELTKLETKNHPCLYLAANLRHSLKKSFTVTINTPMAMSVTFNSEIRMMEKHVSNMISNLGGLERVKATPLPIVYVTHLRTFLMLYLLSMPLLHGHLWGFGTIPIVSLTAFILIGM
jgi:putative membrane protein